MKYTQHLHAIVKNYHHSTAIKISIKSMLRFQWVIRAPFKWKSVIKYIYNHDYFIYNFLDNHGEQPLFQFSARENMSENTACIFFPHVSFLYLIVLCQSQYGNHTKVTVNIF